jgi:hypothetical protein
MARKRLAYAKTGPGMGIARAGKLHMKRKREAGRGAKYKERNLVPTLPPILIIKR